MEYKELEKLVDNYQTKHTEGFTGSEQLSLCKELGVNYGDFCDKLGVNTGLIKDGEFITYYCDVLLAIVCFLENREKTAFEWD